MIIKTASGNTYYSIYCDSNKNNYYASRHIGSVNNGSKVYSYCIKYDNPITTLCTLYADSTKYKAVAGVNACAYFTSYNGASTANYTPCTIAQVEGIPVDRIAQGTFESRNPIQLSASKSWVFQFVKSSFTSPNTEYAVLLPVTQKEYSTSNNNNNQLGFEFTGTNIFCFSGTKGGWHDILSLEGYNLTNETHCAVGYNHTNKTVYYYVNGKLIYTIANYTFNDGTYYLKLNVQNTVFSYVTFINSPSSTRVYNGSDTIQIPSSFVNTLSATLKVGTTGMDTFPLIREQRQIKRFIYHFSEDHDLLPYLGIGHGGPYTTDNLYFFGDNALYIKGLFLGGNDLTLSCWVCVSKAVANARIVILSIGSFSTFIAASTSLFYWCRTNESGVWQGGVMSDVSVQLNTWQHIAIVYQHSTNTWKGYIDGVQIYSTNLAIPAAPSTLVLGGSGNTNDRSTYGLCGQIAQVSIDNGTARWTENFTPPTSRVTGSYMYMI